MISSASAFSELDLLNSKNFVSPAELAFLDCYLDDRRKNTEIDQSRVYQEAKKHITCIKKATFNKSKIKSLLGDGDLESQEKSYNALVEKRLKFLELVNDKLSNSIQFVENNQEKDLNVKIVEQFITTFEFGANIINGESGEEKTQKKRKSKQLEIDTNIPPAITPSSELTTPLSETPTNTTETKVESTPKKRKFNKRTEAAITTNAIKEKLLSIVEELLDHEYADIFRDEVPKDTPDYYESVLKPVHLTQIKERIEKKEITTELELKHQLFLMYQNCIMYNDATTEFYQSAKEMKQFTIDLFSGATKLSTTKKSTKKKKK